MKGISTVGILILTVFLSISVLPVCADSTPPGHPVIFVGYVENEAGLPADGATVTVDANGASVEVEVGCYGASGYWKANLDSTDVSAGDTVTIKVTTTDGSSTGSTTYVVPPSPEASLVSEITLRPTSTPGNGGGDGTYPPGWGETPTPTPTPDATTAPTSTDATEPSVTPPDEDEAVTPVVEGEATAEETETAKMRTPGFGAVFMIAGLLAAVYLVLRRRE